MPDVTPAIALTEALVAELGTALGAMLGADGAISGTSGDFAPGWVISVTVGEPSPGTVTFGLAAGDCTQLAKAITGDEDPQDAAVADLLREVLGQAVGSLREKPAGKGVLFCVETPARVQTAPEGTPQLFTVALGEALAPTIAAWAQFDAVAPKVAAPSASARSTAPAESPRGGGRRGRDDAPAVPPNLDVILDIDLPLSVRFGQTDLTLEALTRLGPGSVIDLGRSPDDPVDVLVNGRLVARAEVVVVGGNYGVRILEVVSAADRVRTLSA